MSAAAKLLAVMGASLRRPATAPVVRTSGELDMYELVEPQDQHLIVNLGPTHRLILGTTRQGKSFFKPDLHEPDRAGERQ